MQLHHGEHTDYPDNLQLTCLYIPTDLHGGEKVPNEDHTHRVVHHEDHDLYIGDLVTMLKLYQGKLE
jgi:hypothetical protein